MLTKPDGWGNLWGVDGTRCEYQILIGENVYSGEDDIEDRSLKLTKPVFTAGKPIGNTPCFSMECCLRQKFGRIAAGSMLELQVRLRNGDQVTEWAPQGTYKIYKRCEYEDNWVKLVCRDKMQMANQSYITDDFVSDDTWPKSMKWIMEDSVSRLGLTLDPKTVIQEGTDWVVPVPVGLSIRAIWSYVAAAHGGNFIITPNQTLLLVTPKASDVSPIPTEAAHEGVELLGEIATVDRVYLTANSLSIYAGESGNNDISVECMYASESAAIYAKGQLTGNLYQPLTAKDLVFDPLAEVQDTYSVDGNLTVWSDLTITCGIIPVAEGKAEATSETASEYGFEDTPLNSLRTKVNGVDQKIDSALDGIEDTVTGIVDGALDGAVDGVTDKVTERLDQQTIFNKLTNNGTAQGFFIQNGQIFINAEYLAADTFNANLIKTGILQSKSGNFKLDLDTGEFTIVGIATQSDLDAIKQGGVDKIVTPVMKYSMSDDGLHIKKPGEEIGNKVDHEGMEVSRGSEPVLKANKDGVVATDVTVRNYLNMGANSRFEDYNDGTDSFRTGCFAM